MPTFCRHNRLIQNCPICAREQSIELRPVVSTSAPRVVQPRTSEGEADGRSAASRPAARPRAGGVRVRRLARGNEDGYASPLVPGLHSSQDAMRLAEEIAFAATRLSRLASHPPGPLAEVAEGADLEERTWLAFLIAYLGPSGDGDPFASIVAARTPWASGELPDLTAAVVGPRGAHDPRHATRTLEAYRSWAARSGSQAAAFTGEAAWTPQRRFDRIYERLALPGLHRDARFELLVLLGWLEVFPLLPGSLKLGGTNETTLGAKRALGIGDPLILDRRAAALAQACGVPLAALDLALFNWGRGERFGDGIDPDVELVGRDVALTALGL